MEVSGRMRAVLQIRVRMVKKECFVDVRLKLACVEKTNTNDRRRSSEPTPILSVKNISSDNRNNNSAM